MLIDWQLNLKKPDADVPPGDYPFYSLKNHRILFFTFWRILRSVYHFKCDHNDFKDLRNSVMSVVPAEVGRREREWVSISIKFFPFFSCPPTNLSLISALPALNVFAMVPLSASICLSTVSSSPSQLLATVPSSPSQLATVPRGFSNFLAPKLLHSLSSVWLV